MPNATSLVCGVLQRLGQVDLRNIGSIVNESLHVQALHGRDILLFVAKSYPFPDAAFPIAIRQQVPPTLLSVPLENAAQIVFLQAGRLAVSDGANATPLQAPGIVCIGAGAGVLVHQRGDVSINRMIIGRELIDQVSVSLYGERILGPLSFGGGTACTECVAVADDAEAVSEIFSEISTELNSRRKHYEDMVRASMSKLIVTIDRNRDPMIKEPVTASTREQFDPDEIIEIITTHYTENYTLQTLAQQFGVNPSYLSRVFKERTGTPLFEYINRIRIQKACLLLKRGDLSILDIALTVGYNNVSFFNRYFRRIMNMAPSDYRKLAKG